MVGGRAPLIKIQHPPPPPAKNKHSGRSKKAWRIICQFSPEYSTKLRQASFFWSSLEFGGKIATKIKIPSFFGLHLILVKNFYLVLPYSECVWTRLQKRPPMQYFTV